MAHVFRTSGQALVHVKHAPNTHHERGNNRDKPRTGDLARAKSLQKFEKNRDFFRTRQQLRSLVSHTFRASGQVLVHVKDAPNTHCEDRNNRAKWRTRDLVRSKSLQKFEKNRDFFRSCKRAARAARGARSAPEGRREAPRSGAGCRAAAQSAAAGG